MIDIVTVIRDFVEGLDLSGDVISLSDDGTNTTLILENSYHLREFMSVNIDETDYQIVSSDASTNTIVVSGIIANASSYTAPNPFFFHGTNYFIGVEFDIKEDADKLPMFYMESLTDEVWSGEEGQALTTPTFKFVLADWSNYADWLADDFVVKRLVGLRKLAAAIRQQSFRYPVFGLIQRFDVQQFYKLGRVKSQSGITDALFNHTLSGVGIRVAIPIYNCNC